jgi:hypothetical protein
MLSLLQQRKLAHLFRVHDTDGNGYVERDDYERMIARIADGRGWRDESAERSELRTRVLAQWAVIASAEQPLGSGRVPLEGWLALWNAVIEVSYEDRVWGVADLLWETMDRDGNGQITREESRCWFDAYGVKGDAADRTFAACDLNGDGYISRDEWRLLVEQFFYSMNPADPGNIVFGPLTEDGA